MKALITYYTQTGNTEKMARAIYDVIPIAKEIRPIGEVKDAAGYAIIFLGFPIHGHSVPSKVLPFFKSLPAGQPLALFSTHGSLRGGQLPKQGFEHAVSLAKEAKVLGALGVRGRVPAKVIDTLAKKVEHQAWAEEAPGAEEHPTEADLADGKAFALEMIAKIGH